MRVGAKGGGTRQRVGEGSRAAGLGGGIDELGGQTVTVSDGRCTLEDGSLAGSTLTMNLALRNLCADCNLSIEQAARASAQNQAEYLGLGHEYGKIQPGFAADFAVLGDDFSVDYTIVGGNIAYQSRR